MLKSLIETYPELGGQALTAPPPLTPSRHAREGSCCPWQDCSLGNCPEPFTPRQLIGKNILQIDLKELYLLALVRTIVYRTCLSAGRYKHKNIPFL